VTDRLTWTKDRQKRDLDVYIIHTILVRDHITSLRAHREGYVFECQYSNTPATKNNMLTKRPVTVPIPKKKQNVNKVVYRHNRT